MIESYLTSVGKVPQMFEAIQNAGIPNRFTIDFVRSIGFKSTNDRAIIGVLKGLGFLDQSGTPTDIYKKYRNKTNSKKILAKAIKDSYSEVFLADENANSAGSEKVKGIIATHVTKGDSVVTKMATTFKALTAIADFSQSAEEQIEDVVIKKENHDEVEIDDKMSHKTISKSSSPQFHYNIQIHLPVTKDISVYNAIFKSIKEHLSE